MEYGKNLDKVYGALDTAAGFLAKDIGGGADGKRDRCRIRAGVSHPCRRADGSHPASEYGH